MLYAPFRETVGRYARALRAFERHIVPDYLDGPSAEEGGFLSMVGETRGQVRRLLRCFPAKIPPDEPDNADFGPVLHPDDVATADAILLPMALALTAEVGVESYGPVGFFREKVALISSAIEVHQGRLSYGFARQATRWRGFAPVVPADAFPGLDRPDPRSDRLDALFDNLQAAVAACRSSVEAIIRYNNG